MKNSIAILETELKWKKESLDKNLERLKDRQKNLAEAPTVHDIRYFIDDMKNLLNEIEIQENIIRAKEECLYILKSDKE